MLDDDGCFVTVGYDNSGGEFLFLRFLRIMQTIITSPKIAPTPPTTTPIIIGVTDEAEKKGICIRTISYFSSIGTYPL